MTPPRYIVEEQLVFVTCGAVGRSFRFLPTRAVVQLLWFVLAVMVRKFGIAVHEVFFLSDHFHIVLTDVRGNLPDFMRDLNSLVSRGLNALRGSTGTNIEKGYNVVVPADDARVVEHSVYTLLNACAAGLVERVRDWVGVSSLLLEYGAPVAFVRPDAGLWKHAVGPQGAVRRRATGSRGRGAYAGRTRMPERVEFALVRPAIHPELSDAELRELIRDRVRARELELASERRLSGRRVLGMAKILRQRWNDTASTTRVLFDTTPRVSGRRKSSRLAALCRRLDFESAHATAQARLCEILRLVSASGATAVAQVRELLRLHDVQFPHGTFLMRRRYGVRCCAGP